MTMPAKRKRQHEGELAGIHGGSSGKNNHEISDSIIDAHDVNGQEILEANRLDSVGTPSKSRRGRPSKGRSGHRLESHVNGDYESTPSKSKSVNLFSTPSKTRQFEKSSDKDVPVTNGEESARSRSARTMVNAVAVDGVSDDDNRAEENLLARKVWNAENEDSDDEENESGDGIAAEQTGPETPSKRKRRRQKRSLTPPSNLPPHEQYLWQNRPGKVKTSNNTLSSISLLNHERYHNHINSYEDPHVSSYSFLHSLHSRSFPQWRFEVSQTFNLCLYGYGSKRRLVTAFASYLHAVSPSDPPQIMIVNGYNPTLTLRHLLTTFATLVFQCTPSTLPSKLGTQPREIISTLLSHLTINSPSTPHYIFINSLDAAPLRRSPTPTLLSQLAASPHVHLVATCDTPNFPLLWDTNLRDQYNFLFHDTTTFESYASIEIPSVIDDVNELLNRSGRSVKGKEGVGFVLQSLPENARNLYRVLIAELLSAIDEGEGGSNGVGDYGVEYKVLYQKVVEEFICSNEMGFRQLLKEFFDHQMVVSRRDASGAEMLGVPWRREEMEGILEDLMG